MIIRYHQIPDEEIRDEVRLMNECGHTSYISYLLLKRYKFSDITQELINLDLESYTPKQVKHLFIYGIKPILKKYGVFEYYQNYEYQPPELAVMTLEKSFSRNEENRISFIQNVIGDTDTSIFFSEEVKDFYNGIIPRSGGKPIMVVKEGNYFNILTHDNRAVVDNFLEHGRTPKEISEYLSSVNISGVTEIDIEAYQLAFQNATTLSIGKVISEADEELASVENRISSIKNDHTLTLGQRSSMLRTLSSKRTTLQKKLKKMRSMHSSNAFGSATLEYANIRDMYSDVVQSTFKRYKKADRRSEDNVVDVLNKVVSIMHKSTQMIMQLDQVMNSTESKTITDEMLEIIKPNLDRLEEEERKAIETYERKIGLKSIENDEIIGFEE